MKLRTNCRREHPYPRCRCLVCKTVRREQLASAPELVQLLEWMVSQWEPDKCIGLLHDVKAKLAELKGGVS